MRSCVALLAVLFWSVRSFGGAAVQVNLHCLSLRFAPATAKVLGQTHTMSISRDQTDPPNGELSLAPNNIPYSHGGYLRYDPPDFTGPYFFQFYVDVPPFQDLNRNGFHDFFEVDQSVNSTRTTGAYEDPLRGEGQLRATWTRAAGSKDGTCKLELPDLGLTFNHTFEVIQFDGALVYAAAGTNLTGTVDLKQALKTDNALQGPVVMSRVDTNHVALAPGAWTNVAAQVLSYEAFEQLERTGTRYAAFFGFKDGDPDTTGEDYMEWVLMLTDTNDSNGNGIPDLSDGGTPALAPRLVLQKADKSLQLTIEGEAGRSYDLEAAAGLGSPGWATQLTIVMTNTIQSVSLGLPAIQTSFWRARVK